MQIARLQQTEIAEAANLIAIVFSERWREPAMMEFARAFNGEAHPTHIFVAKQDGEIVGIAGCLETYFAEHTYGLGWVGVLETHRGQGIASRLIEAVEKFIAAELLQSAAGTLLLSTDKTALYEKLSFTGQTTPMHDGTQLMVKVIEKRDGPIQMQTKGYARPMG